MTEGLLNRLHLPPYARRMFAGGVGPTSSILILLFVPIPGAFLLSTEEFAVWAILNSVATISLAIDFGGLRTPRQTRGKLAILDVWFSEAPRSRPRAVPLSVSSP